MIENDTLIRMQLQASAQEFVIKILIHMINQLVPKAGLQQAMHQALENSVTTMGLKIRDADFSEQEIQDYILRYGRQILDSAFDAEIKT